MEGMFQSNQIEMPTSFQRDFMQIESGAHNSIYLSSFTYVIFFSFYVNTSS